MAHDAKDLEACLEQIGRRRFLRNAGLAGVGLTGLLLPGAAAQAGGLFAQASPDDQKKVGDQAAAQVLTQYHEVFDRRASHFNAIGQRLVRALPDSDRTTWNFKFHVLDSKTVNAFALPGGNMFMFTGLYQILPTDDALAGVTGHEMTHVRLQHWAKANAKQQQRQVGIGLLLGIFHAGSAVQSLAGLADNAIGLKYSRGEEDQADQGGLQNMVDAGYNPQGMIELFQALEKVSGNGGGGVGGDFLSDHPLTSDRIKHTQDRIAALQNTHTFPPVTPLHYAALLPGK